MSHCVVWYLGTNVNVEPVASVFGEDSLKMEVACAWEILVCTYETTQCHIPQDHSLNNHFHENLEDPIYVCTVMINSFCYTKMVSAVKHQFYSFERRTRIRCKIRECMKLGKWNWYNWRRMLMSLHHNFDKHLKYECLNQLMASHLKCVCLNKETVNENTLTCIPYTHVPICTLTCAGIHILAYIVNVSALLCYMYFRPKNN